MRALQSTTSGGSAICGRPPLRLELKDEWWRILMGRRAKLDLVFSNGFLTARCPWCSFVKCVAVEKGGLKGVARQVGLWGEQHAGCAIGGALRAGLPRCCA